MEEMQEERRIEEMQMQIKMKELELEQFMLSKEKRVESAFGVTFKYKINLWSTSDFFHLFLEKDVDKQFVHFEKIAKSLTSPNEYWTLLLQNALTRKAGETSSNYEEFQSHFESIWIGNGGLSSKV